MKIAFDAPEKLRKNCKMSKPRPRSCHPLKRKAGGTVCHGLYLALVNENIMKKYGAFDNSSFVCSSFGLLLCCEENVPYSAAIAQRLSIQWR
jgi:hypothetical protein